MSNINRVLIDSRFRTPDSKSTSDFRVELPEGLQMGEQMACVTCDISLPVTWYTIETNVNDKLYFRIYEEEDGVITYKDYIMQLPSRNYNRTQVAETLTAGFLAMNVPLSASEDIFRNEIRIFLPTTSPLSFMIFTNTDLRSRCNNTWLGEYYIPSNPQSINDMLANSERDMKRYDALNRFQSGRFRIVPHPVLYIVCPQLGTFGNLGPQGERDILKKILVTADQNELMFEQYINIDDYVDVSKLSVRNISFKLTDVYGNVIDLHGRDWSFTLLFKPI